MATPNTSATRQTLEDSYNLKKHTLVTRKRQSDTEDYRQEQPDGTPHDPKGALALARQGESEALAEYSSILRAFTGLTVNGKVPEERSEAGSDSL